MKPFDYIVLFVGLASWGLFALSLWVELSAPNQVQLAKSLAPKKWEQREARQRNWILFGLICFAFVAYRRWG